MLIDLLPTGEPNELLGEQGRIVVVDEAKVVKVRHNRGGFVGSPILGNNTWVMVGIELNQEEMPRHETGRCFAVILPDRSYESFRAALLPRLARGCTVWTDGYTSYRVLDDHGFRHERVLHAGGEFSRVRGFRRRLKHKFKRWSRGTGRGLSFIRFPAIQ